MHATIRLPRGVGFLDLHVEPTQILQFVGLPFGSILSISLQNDAARTIASKNEIGHFVCLEVSEKKAAGTARCDQPGSNNLVRKTLDPPTLSSNTEPSTEDCGVIIVVQIEERSGCCATETGKPARRYST
jgi:hypothetical protein